MESMTWRRFTVLLAGLSGDSRLAGFLHSTKKAGVTKRETPSQAIRSLRALAG
jgi:hypothetical protein